MANQTAIYDALRQFANSRPGFDWRNYYSDWRDTTGRTAYRSDVRKATQQLHDARALLLFVSLNRIEVDKHFDRAFSGRLQWDGKQLDYCTGQYYPLEYRAAVCAVLASAIWAWWRDECGYDTGAGIRKKARSEFGRGLAARWFN